ncbi:ribonuclease 2-like [Musa acuminata AAA Group]|uniref:ribonuclease 2-like n=1 Tax=Musa acuminata AAA Group TaxID=214697 RepID=UPI0031D2C92C
MACVMRLLGLLFVLVCSLSLPLPSFHSVVATGQREFDYFVLALLWPGTICQATHHCCSSNACCRSNPLPEFTIHGLWTDYNDGSWPACCSHSDFDIKKITSLLPTLEKYWPSLYCSSSSLCFGGKGLFWAHEEVLNNAGILATNGEKYPLGDVVATIKRAFGATPLLVCKHGSLEELRLCFYKDYKPRDCVTGSDILNGMPHSRNSCPRYITLPTYTPLGLADSSKMTLEEFDALTVA